MCEYGFTENQDYTEVSDKIVHNPMGGRPATDHTLTLDMAKEICMLQRTEQGKAVRRYLLDIERQWNTPEAVLGRALQIVNAQKDELANKLSLANVQLEAAKPKVLFAEAVSASETSILIGDLAKLLRQNGVDIGQNRLFERLRGEGYLMKDGASRNLPTQKAMDMGLFQVKETTINNPDGSIRVTRTTKVTGKGQIYFANRFIAI